MLYPMNEELYHRRETSQAQKKFLPLPPSPSLHCVTLLDTHLLRPISEDQIMQMLDLFLSAND